MDQLKKLLANLSLKQKITLVLAATLVGGSLFAFTRWRRERDFRPLYTGLAAEDAGAVVQKLRESGVDYRLGENGAVLAPSAKTAELRLQMASAGLPRSGRAGFELFDKSNFGVTDFAEHINYRRALEGELERSVMSLAEVEHARVHVTFPKDSIFLEARQPAKASIMVRLRPGAHLSPQNVLAITHLAASAVEGLAPEAVSVLDMQGNLLSRPRRSIAGDGEQPPEATLEYKHQIEKDLLAKIGSTLEPLLGADRFRAGVSVECDFSGGEQSEETFDPTRSVMASSQKTEDISGANASSGMPGTASNLPRPVSRPGSGGLGMTRRTENIAYQSSRTVRRLRLPQGTVKRVSTAVLVDQTVRWEGTGAAAKRIVEPPSPEKLKVIRDLVAAATGFISERGDQLIVETLPFESTLNVQAPPPAPAPAKPAPAARLPFSIDALLENRLLLAAVAGGALLLLIFAAAAIVFLSRKKKRRAGPAVSVQAALPGAPPSGQAALEPAEPLPDVSQTLESKLAEQLAQRDRQELDAIAAMKLPQIATKKVEVLAKHLMDAAKKDPSSFAYVLRAWLRENR